jgi:predicted nucleotide-binding protein
MRDNRASPMPYHVRITHKSPQRRSSDTLALDKSEDWLAEHVVGPRGRGEKIFVGGMVIDWDDVDSIHITYTEATSADLLPGIRQRRRAEGIVVPIEDEWYVAYEGEDVTERFLVGPPGKRMAATTVIQVAEHPKQVMVVHGQDQDATSAMFDWLRALGLRPREWAQLVRATQQGSPFIGDVLDRAFRASQAVVVLFTPDELVSLRPEITGAEPAWRLQARPNVLFEAGMALATYPDRTILVVLGPQDLPTDLSGRHCVRVREAADLKEIAQRLETAGCPIDTTGSDWLDVRRFPDRSDVRAASATEDQRAASLSADRRRAYAALLTAHGKLVLAYSGERIYDSRIRDARAEFDQAQSEVLLVAGPPVRAAAEALRQAWVPSRNGMYMAQDWKSEVERARDEFVSAAHEDT